MRRYRGDVAGTRTRDWAEVDFYAVLGVPTDATDDDIGRGKTLAVGRRGQRIGQHVDAGTGRHQVREAGFERSGVLAVKNDVHEWEH